MTLHFINQKETEFFIAEPKKKQNEMREKNVIMNDDNDNDKYTMNCTETEYFYTKLTIF